MIETPVASERIRDEVTSWPGVIAGLTDGDELSFRFGRHEIGRLHGDQVAHFGFPRELWAKLLKQGRIGPSPVLADSPGQAARRIENEDDVRDVIALFRLSYDRLVARHGLPQLARP